MGLTVWEKVDASGDCWIWTGATNRQGYGTHYHEEKKWLAHRLVWSLLVGPPGPILDHLCRVPGCVNPDHLEPVTARTNLLRGETIPARHRRKTKCPKGHPYSGTT